MTSHIIKKKSNLPNQHRRLDTFPKRGATEVFKQKSDVI